MSGAVNWTEQQVADYYAGRGKGIPLTTTAEKKTHSRGSHTPGTMNKIESRCAQYLDLMKKMGDLKEWFFEKVTLKIGPDCRLTVDFMLVMTSGEIKFWEVKHIRRGTMHSEDDSKVKMRVAAGMFPWRFYWVVPMANGSWEEIPVIRE